MGNVIWTLRPLSDDSLFIENLGESLTAAAWLAEYPTRPDAKPEVVALIPANLPTHAQAAVSTTERRRGLLGASDAARRRRQGLDLDALMIDGTIAGGMIPKVESCVHAVRNGVRRAHILDGRIPHVLLLEVFTDEGIGTMVQ